MTRECGDCSLCCKLMSIPVMESPAGAWCKNCTPGKGCNIWQERPQICRDFLCAWAQGLVPEAAKPSECKVVLTWTSDGKYPVAHVDPARPDAWKKEPIGAWLQNMATALGRAYIVCGDKRTFIGWDTPDALKAELEGLLR